MSPGAGIGFSGANDATGLPQSGAGGAAVVAGVAGAVVVGASSALRAAVALARGRHQRATTSTSSRPSARTRRVLIGTPASVPTRPATPAPRPPTRRASSSQATRSSERGRVVEVVGQVGRLRWPARVDDARSNSANAVFAGPSPVAAATASSCWPPSSRASSFACSERYWSKRVPGRSRARRIRDRSVGQGARADADAVRNRSSNAAPEPRAISASALRALGVEAADAPVGERHGLTVRTVARVVGLRLRPGHRSDARPAPRRAPPRSPPPAVG